MSKLLQRFTPTKLGRKLIGRITLVAAISLVLSFALAYALFWPQLRNDAHEMADSASRVIMLSLNETLENLDGYVEYMTSSELLSERIAACGSDPTYEDFLAVEGTLRDLKSISANMRAVALIDWEGGYYQAGLLGEQDRSLLSSTWVTDSASDSPARNWSSFYISHVEKPENTICRISVCAIGGHICTLGIFYDADSLMEQIESLAKTTYTGYLLTDRSGGLQGPTFYRSGDVGNAEAVSAAYAGQEPYSAKDGKGHYFITTIPVSGWRLVGFIDRATFNASLTPFIWLLFLICLVLGLLIVMLFIPSVNRVLSPLGELKTAMQNVSVRGQDYYSPVQTDDEIGELSDVFNDMLDELRVQHEQSLEQQSREQLLTYNLMVSQINSHFFYNTMSVINSLSRQGRNEDVIRANTALTTIFQDCLRSQSAAVGDTVAQEKAIVECYWVIESLEPSNEAKLCWSIPEELLEKRIPKNIIQPLVENALFHGLDDVQTGRKTGWIDVSLCEEDGCLFLSVSNNGAPIAEDVLTKLNADAPLPDGAPHIGLANIRRRLRMIYGGDASLTITSEDITTVSIRMPDVL